MNSDAPATKKDIADLENAITGFAGQIMNTLQDHTDRLDRIDDTLEVHNQRFDRIDDTLEDHTQRLEQIERKLDSTVESVDRLDYSGGRPGEPFRPPKNALSPYP